MEDEEINKHDADAGNDGYSNELLQKEHLIDPGNEHNHLDEKGAPDKAPQKGQKDEWVNKHDADAGGDGTGTMGPAPPKDGNKRSES
jgi:hypothetical protein